MKSLPIFALLSLCYQSALFEEVNQDDVSNFVSTKKHSQDEAVEILSRVNFDCTGRKVSYYSDLEFDCKVFHFCDKQERRFTYKCANGKRFDQDSNTCTLDYIPSCRHREIGDDQKIIEIASEKIEVRPGREPRRDKRARAHFASGFPYEYVDAPRHHIPAFRGHSSGGGKSFANPFDNRSGIGTLSAFASLAQNNNVDFNESRPKPASPERKTQIDRAFHHTQNSGRRNPLQNEIPHSAPKLTPHTFNRPFGPPDTPPQHRIRDVPLLNLHHPNPHERLHRRPPTGPFHHHSNIPSREFQPDHFVHRDQDGSPIRLPLQNAHFPARSHFSFTPPGSPAPVTHRTISHNIPDFQHPAHHRFDPFLATPSPALHIQPNPFQRPPTRPIAAHSFHGGLPGSRHHSLHNERPAGKVVPQVSPLINHHNQKEQDEEYYYYYEDEYGDKPDGEYYYDYVDYEKEPEVEKPTKINPISKNEKRLQTRPKHTSKPQPDSKSTARIPYKPQSEIEPQIKRIPEAEESPTTKRPTPVTKNIKPTTLPPSINRVKPFRIPFSNRRRKPSRHSPKNVAKEINKEERVNNRNKNNNQEINLTRDEIMNKLKKVAQEKRPTPQMQPASKQRNSDLNTEKKIAPERATRPKSSRPSRPSRITQFFKAKLPERNDRLNRRRLHDRKRKTETKPTQKDTAEIPEKESIPKSLDQKEQPKQESVEENPIPKVKEPPKDQEPKVEMKQEQKEDPITTNRSKNPNVRAKFDEFLKNRRNRLASLRTPTRRRQRTQRKKAEVKMVVVESQSKVEDGDDKANLETKTDTTELEEEVRKKRLSNDLEFSSSIRVPKKEAVEIAPDKTLRYLLRRNNGDSFNQQLVKAPLKESISGNDNINIGESNISSHDRVRNESPSKITNHKIVTKPNFKQFVRMSPNDPRKDFIESPDIITAPPQDFSFKVSTSYNNNAPSSSHIPTSAQNHQETEEKKHEDTSTDPTTLYTILIDQATSFQMNKIESTTSKVGLNSMSKPVFNLDNVHQRNHDAIPRYISASSKRGDIEPEDRSHIKFVPFLLPAERPLLPIEKLMKIT